MSDFSARVPLGRTGLMVSRLGVGSSYGVSPRACFRAYDAGVNYFYWGSMRTRGMGTALRELARKNRESIVVVLQSYARRPWMLRKSVERGLASLGIEQADVLLLGWYDTPPAARVLDAANELRARGRFRFLAISSHKRVLFQRYLADGCYDIFHVRYNAAHRGAEQEVFPYLSAERGPGLVSYTNTRWGDLLRAKNMPAGMTAPTASDCYRFSLSSSAVHVALCGPGSDEEMDEALRTLRRGPLDAAELERMRTIGDAVHGTASLMSIFS